MKRCIVVSMAPFPHGNVSTLRFTSYLESLQLVGIKCSVIIYCPTSMAAKNDKREGEYNGIKYWYSAKISWNKPHISLVTKAFYLIYGLLNSFRLIYNNKPDSLILYGDNPFVVNLFYWITCRVLKIKYFGDRSEYPSIKIRKSKIRLWLYKKKNALFDGMIIMTKELMSFYQSCSSKLKLFHLPMTINCSRFDGIASNTSDNYIAVVFGTHNRDGLKESLLAFKEYRNELHGKFRLRLIGNFEGMPNHSELVSIIKEGDIYKDIDIMGLVDINDVPAILRKAKCLLSTPNFYISGGFPTKLGEYMLSQSPIVITNAGEISNYLDNMVDAFIVPPGEISEIAHSIKYIEENPEKAYLMGINAEKKAKVVFNASTYISDLVDFLNLNESFSQ